MNTSKKALSLSLVLLLSIPHTYSADDESSYEFYNAVVTPLTMAFAGGVLGAIGNRIYNRTDARLSALESRREAGEDELELGEGDGTWWKITNKETGEVIEAYYSNYIGNIDLIYPKSQFDRESVEPKGKVTTTVIAFIQSGWKEVAAVAARVKDLEARGVRDNADLEAGGGGVSSDGVLAKTEG